MGCIEVAGSRYREGQAGAAGTDSPGYVAAVGALIGETAPDIVSLAEAGEAWGAPGSLRDLAGRWVLGREEPVRV